MNRQSVEFRAARVSLVTGISTVLAILMQLVSVPVCMNFWGQQTYGVWLTVIASFMMVRSLDSGYVAYVGNRLNYLYHVDPAALRKHLASAVSGVVLLAAIELTIGIAVAFSVPLANALGISDSASFDADRVGLIVLLAAWVLTGPYLGIVHRLQTPAGMMYQAAWWSMLFQAIQFVAIIVAALAGLTIVQTAAVFALAQAGVYLLSAWYIAVKLPNFYPWWEGGRWNIGLQDLWRSGAVTLATLLQQGTSNGVVLVIAAVGSAASVPLFTTVRTLANLWTNVSNVLTGPLLPDIVRYQANGEVAKLRIAVRTHWVVVGSAVNASVVLGYPLLATMYSHWTRHRIDLDVPLLASLLGAVVITNAGALIALHLTGMNHLQVVLGTAILRSIGTLGVGVLTYQFLGVAAFGIGVLVGEFAVLVVIYHAFQKRLATAPEHAAPRAGIYPAALGVISVLLFLLTCATRVVPLLWSVPSALAVLTISAIWGWVDLPREIRARLAGLAQLQGRPSALGGETATNAK
jgi:O-antigen/teichoic acid export membrane protein